MYERSGFNYLKQAMDDMKEQSKLFNIVSTETVPESSSSKKGDERKMADSQSRYGIIEEMKNKKIAEINKLALLKEEKDKHTNTEKDDLETIKISMDGHRATYKQNHRVQQKKRERNVVELETELRTKIAELNAKFKEAIDSIKDEIIDTETTYEKDFETYVKNKQDMIDNKNKKLESFIKTKDREITTKETVIKEIEKGITDLKQISKEQKGDNEK